MATKHKAVWMPCPYEVKHVRALQALNQGNALPHQQQEALRFIIEIVAGTYDMSFRPESERDTCFAEGRRYVGLQLVKFLALIPGKLKSNKEQEDE